MENPGQVTCLLQEVAQGSRDAESRLLPLIRAELRHIAAAYLRAERRDHTLQPTALVHDAYLKVLRGQHPEWRNRAHFYAIAAQAMRMILIDHARRRLRSKRGGHRQRLSLDQVILSCQPFSLDVIAVHEAIERLSVIDPRQSRIVELKFFAGLSTAEISEVMAISPRTVRRDWTVARAWLFGDLRGSHGNGARQMEKSQVAV